MQVFSNINDAQVSATTKDSWYLNSECPFNTGRLCGNWCALFYIYKENGLPRYVIMGCKGTDKKLYVE